MNNKGFTLIELLAVLVILVSISLVTVGGITASLDRRDVKECEEQKKLAISAAKMYFSLNNVDSVSVLTLKSNNYFSNNKKVDRLMDTDTISIGSDSYVYSGTNCE